MRHQDRHRRIAEDVAGCAAEKHLPQAALRVGPLDEQVASERRGFPECASPGLFDGSLPISASAGMPCVARDRTNSEPDGPGTPQFSNSRTTTRRAFSSRGIDPRTARAVSVLRFHAITMVVPRVLGATGGAISTGRPVSNSADSTVDSRVCPFAPSGRPSTVTSNTRP